MNTKLFVGGFPYETTQADLLKLFSSAGAVFGIKLVIDKETGRAKYAFVEMATEADAKAAMEKLNGAPIGGRKMFLSEARPQQKKDGPGGAPATTPPNAAAPAPGFVERRSGRDRRVRPGFGSPAGSSAAPAPADRRAPPVEEKKWSSKFGFGEKKPWADKKPFGDRKPFGEKKPWADKKAWGDKAPGDRKPWDDKKPADRKPWADRKAWADKPSSGEKPAGYTKKPWADLPAAGKKWTGKPGAGGKPGGGKKPWGPKPEGKPGGFTRRARRGSN